MKYRKTKIFDNKKIIIRSASKSDLKQVKKFQIFYNSLVEEDVMINRNEKVSIRYEIDWLKNRIDEIKNHRSVILIAEYNNIIVGSSNISLKTGRSSYVGGVGISIEKNYRKIGLGIFLIKEIIKLARKELIPKPKILRLSVMPNNKPALKLYEKTGFTSVAKIPRQFQYKGKLVDEIIMLMDL